MAVTLETIRQAALALPEVTEEPHHHFGSFRVRGKIFLTVPPGGELLHIFVPEQERERALAMDPEFLEPLLWGGKVVGLRAKLPLAQKAKVLDLVHKAYAHRSIAISRTAKRTPAPRRPPPNAA